jgi:hypothetical protein
MQANNLQPEALNRVVYAPCANCSKISPDNHSADLGIPNLYFCSKFCLQTFKQFNLEDLKQKSIEVSKEFGTPFEYPQPVTPRTSVHFSVLSSLFACSSIKDMFQDIQLQHVVQERATAAGDVDQNFNSGCVAEDKIGEFELFVALALNSSLSVKDSTSSLKWLANAVCCCNYMESLVTTQVDRRISIFQQFAGVVTNILYRSSCYITKTLMPDRAARRTDKSFSAYDSFGNIQPFRVDNRSVHFAQLSAANPEGIPIYLNQIQLIKMMLSSNSLQKKCMTFYQLLDELRQKMPQLDLEDFILYNPQGEIKSSTKQVDDLDPTFAPRKPVADTLTSKYQIINLTSRYSDYQALFEAPAQPPAQANPAQPAEANNYKIFLARLVLPSATQEHTPHLRVMNRLITLEFDTNADQTYKYNLPGNNEVKVGNFSLKQFFRCSYWATLGDVLEMVQSTYQEYLNFGQGHKVLVYSKLRKFTIGELIRKLPVHSQAVSTVRVMDLDSKLKVRILPIELFDQAKSKIDASEDLDEEKPVEIIPENPPELNPLPQLLNAETSSTRFYYVKRSLLDMILQENENIDYADSIPRIGPSILIISVESSRQYFNSAILGNGIERIFQAQEVEDGVYKLKAIVVFQNYAYETLLNVNDFGPDSYMQPAEYWSNSRGTVKESLKDIADCIRFVVFELCSPAPAV